MLLGVIGINELIIILIPIALVFLFVYKYGKLKGRVRELERQIEEKNASGK